MSFCPQIRDFIAVVGLFVATLPAQAQTARVQFIHASVYEEAQTVDVYTNGVLELDDLAYTTGTPFHDHDASVPLKIEVRWGEPQDGTDPFFAQTLTLTPNEKYVVIAAGDPMRREGEPPFKFFVRSGALEFSRIPELADYLLFNHVPHTSVSHSPRGMSEGVEDENPRVDQSYGEFIGYLPGAKLAWELDAFLVDFDSVWSFIQDLGLHGERAAVLVGAGTFGILSDGTNTIQRKNVAAVQFINISQSSEADTVDVYVNDMLTLDDLAFREATPLIELPSGTRDETAPVLTIDVTRSGASDNSEPLFTLERRFLFGRSYASILAGDSEGMEGDFPTELFVSDRTVISPIPDGLIDIVLFHGATGIPAVAIGIEGTLGPPLASQLVFGTFETGKYLPAADTTLYVIDAFDTKLLATYQLNLGSMGLKDSTLVLLTSSQQQKGQRSGKGDIGLLAALPTGGKLLSFDRTLPPPWWQQPFYWLIGLVGLSVVVAVGSQLRVRRLEVHARELSTLVEERTRELRLEKEKTEEQARRLVELDEAKNRFFANISHEFRTPLTLILGPIQDLIDGAFGKLPTGVGAQHRLVRRSARRLLRLVNQLLDLSRLESGKMELHRRPGDLIGFLRELVGVFTPLAERRRVTLNLTSSLDTLPTNFDADAIEKVFANLVSNALKFTPEGGRVTVQADLLIEGDARQARISVRDTGAGIPAEHLERIFERFQQGDTSIRRAHEGSGIGLTLARELAELHGGSLSAESVVGEGSTFTVTLPIEEPVGEPEPALREVETALLEEPLIAPEMDDLPSEILDPELDAPLILVVEDNADVREYLRSHLGARYRLIEAEDGQAGLEAAREHKPDLILSDVMMPRMDGYEMCRLIKANEDLRHIPIIMLTAKAAEKDTVEGLESGADDYIAKPFSTSELQARVSNFISVRRALREKFSREIIVKPGDIQITPEDEVFLQSVLEVADKHLGDANFSIDWMADEIGVSRRNLERHIHDVTGQTPADLMRTMRLQRASQLLRARAGSVSEIAYAVGFASPKHFSVVFRDKYGVSPSEHAITDSPPSA